MSKNEKLGLDDVYICAFHNSMTSKRKIIAFNTSDGLIDGFNKDNQFFTYQHLSGPMFIDVGP